MLTSINLQLTEPTAFNADQPTEMPVSGDSTTSDAGFATLLKQPPSPVEPAIMTEAGQTLPEGGNILPGGIMESSLLPKDAGPGEPEPSVPVAVDTVAMDSLLPNGTLVNVAAQVSTATITAEFGQSANPQSGSVNLASDLTALQVKTTVVDPLQLESGTGVGRDSATQREVPGAQAIDRIQQMVRSSLSADPEGATEFRATLRESSGDPLAAMLERPQVPLGATTGTTMPTTNIIATALTATQGSLLAAAPTVAPTPAPIDIPLHDSAWGNALNDRVLFMTGQKIHTAEIRLNPAEMGPITIRIAVDDGAADITFTAQHVVAREAIELAMPRLRELLSENGLLLANTSVTEEGVEQDAKGHDAQERVEWNGGADESLAEADPATMIPVRVAQGLDTFV
jgi:flagellar hook-length control protein FliK